MEKYSRPLVFFFFVFFLGFFYLYFISGYSITELKKKQEYLQDLKNNFSQEKNKNDFLSKKNNQQKKIDKHLNQFGFSRENEVLVDVQIPPVSLLEEIKEKKLIISKSGIIFLTVFFLLIIINFFFKYKRKSKSLVKDQ